jgi:hypothetical protein
VVTFLRLVQSSIEDLAYAHRVARLRSFYLRVAPELEPYLVAVLGARSAAPLPPSAWQLTLTAAGMVAVVNSAVVAACAVQDHALRVVEQADGFRQLLQNILSVNLTLETKSLAEMSNALTEMSNNQNEEVKTISAWAAILFAPTLVGTVYGMKFENVPELAWELGYPLALALMALLGVALYLLFKRRNWI